MFRVTTDTTTGKRVGIEYYCHGCGRISKSRKGDALPNGWVKRSENIFTESGNPTRSNSSVHNYYCPSCAWAGCTAATVAATTRKLLRIGKAKD